MVNAHTINKQPCGQRIATCKSLVPLAQALMGLTTELALIPVANYYIQQSAAFALTSSGCL